MKYVLFCSIFGAFMANAALGDDWDCPEMDSAITAGGFDFEYQSWTWSHNYGHRLCHCVRNNSLQNLFVEWEDTSLRGFVRPGSTNYVMSSFPDNRFRTQKSSLWYGASPREQPVDTMVYDPTIVAGNPNQTLETFSKTSIPFGALEFASSELELVEIVEISPDILVDFFMEFSSEVSPINGSKTYSCSYRIDGRVDWASSYVIGFESLELNEAMFGSPDGLVFYQGQLQNYTSGDGRSFENEDGKLVFRFTTELRDDEPAVVEGNLIVSSLEGVRAAEMPIRYHEID